MTWINVKSIWHKWILGYFSDHSLQYQLIEVDHENQR